MEEFQFMEPVPMSDGEIALRLEAMIPGNAEKELVPAYTFAICEGVSGEKVGEISLRVGDNLRLYYGGHIGYGVDKPWRGRRYAARACRLLFDFARKHGMKQMIITCNPDNIPSKRTIEAVGGRLLEIVDLPEDNDMYLEGERQKCIFEIIL